MTTAKFIEMLQEADPSGTAHIRMSGGIPRFAELKEGYWDGPFSYINEKGNYVYSINGLKVDIHCDDIDSFIEDNYYHGKTTWEDIKQLFEFELDGYVNLSQREERKNNILDKAKKSFDEMYKMNEEFRQKELKEAKERVDAGWKWFQNKEVDNVKSNEHNLHVFHTWIIVSPDGKESKGSNAWSTRVIIESGLWEKLDNNVKEGYYQWIYKN